LYRKVSLTLFVWCVVGGQNDQTLSNAGPEADLDTQFALGLSFPTPGTFFSTGGSPPFNPDVLTPANTNEPYDDVSGVFPFFYSADVLTHSFGACHIQWLHFMLGLRDGAIPQTITTSYSDDEQTGKNTTFSSHLLLVRRGSELLHHSCVRPYPDWC